MQKYFVAFIFLAALVCINAQSHNATWGTRNIRDIHLKRAVIFKKSSFLRKVDDDYELSLRDVPHVNQISQIQVTDQYTNGKGGYATLTSGGPHFDFVKLHFVSQRGHGFNFIVDVYGQ